MNFKDYVERIMSTLPKSLEHYHLFNQMLVQTLLNNLETYIKSSGDEQTLDLLKVKARAVKVNMGGENSIYGSAINYRRLHGYIEFYNEEKQRLVRLIISTTGDETFICGFYINHKNNNKNNYLSKDCEMVNELYGPLKIANTFEFTDQMAKFLMGSLDTPYVQRTEKPKLH